MFEIFIQDLIIQGVPEYTILVLLYLPIVATLVSVSRYIIGWKSLSIYSTVLLVFALYDIARLDDGSINILKGLFEGGVIAASVTSVAVILQSLSRDLRLHYVSKISIILGFVSAVVFLLLKIAVEMQNYDLRALSPIGILIMVVVLDIFVRSYIRKGRRKAFIYIANTIGLSFLIFTIIAQPIVRSYVMDYPAIIFATIIINLFLGRWTGLRLTEYLRFRDITIKDQHDTQQHSKQE